MRRLMAMALTFSLSGVGSAMAAGPQAAQTGSISGVASSAAGQPIAGTTVQLRNVANGSLVATSTSDAVGAFSFADLPAGNYVIEVMNAAGEIVGSSAMIEVAAGATISGVAVRAPAVNGASGLAASKSFFATKLGMLTAAATAAAVAGVTVAATRGTASPSR
jgi:hypothetical protein